MKLYDKKFLIYENCMIRSFGQPGLYGLFRTDTLHNTCAMKFIYIYQLFFETT